MGGILVGGGGHTAEGQMRLNRLIQEQENQKHARKKFDSDIEYAKRSLEMEPGSKVISSNERSFGPGMAASRLEEAGVDLPGLIGNRVSPEANDGNLKRGGAVKKMASGGSVSSRADGIAQRGKTKCKMC